MTLSTTAARVSHAGNNATTTFPFAFKIWAPANLTVYLRNNATLADALQTLNADYTIDIVTYPATGNVVFANAPPAGHTVVIVRDMALTQDLDLIASGTFAAENVEHQLDKLTAQIQTLRELLARTPRLAPGTALADPALPEPRSAVANQLLAVNATGDGFDLKVPVDLSLQTVSSFIGTLLDDADAAAARTTTSSPSSTRRKATPRTRCASTTCSRPRSAPRRTRHRRSPRTTSCSRANLPTARCTSRCCPRSASANTRFGYRLAP
jgi:hypothetical protein